MAEEKERKSSEEAFCSPRPTLRLESASPASQDQGSSFPVGEDTESAQRSSDGIAVDFSRRAEPEMDLDNSLKMESVNPSSQPNSDLVREQGSGATASNTMAEKSGQQSDHDLDREHDGNFSSSQPALENDGEKGSDVDNKLKAAEELNDRLQAESLLLQSIISQQVSFVLPCGGKGRMALKHIAHFQLRSKQRNPKLERHLFCILPCP